MANDPNAFPQSNGGGSGSDPGERLVYASAPLEILGGYDEVRNGVEYLSGLMQGEEPDICALVVEGAEIQPCGLPSMLLGPTESARIIYDEGKARAGEAMMRGESQGAWKQPDMTIESQGAVANLHYGRDVMGYARTFLERLVEVVSPELEQDQIAELQQLLAARS